MLLWLSYEKKLLWFESFDLKLFYVMCIFTFTVSIGFVYMYIVCSMLYKLYVVGWCQHLVYIKICAWAINHNTMYCVASYICWMCMIDCHKIHDCVCMCLMDHIHWKSKELNYSIWIRLALCVDAPSACCPWVECLCTRPKACKTCSRMFWRKTEM